MNLGKRGGFSQFSLDKLPNGLCDSQGSFAFVQLWEGIKKGRERENSAEPNSALNAQWTSPVLSYEIRESWNGLGWKGW